MKKLLLISGIIIVGIGGTIYYYWQQFNYVPPVNSSSITQLSNNPENQAILPQKTEEIKQKINQVLPRKTTKFKQKNTQNLPENKPIEINLTEDNLNTLILNQISKNEQISPGVKSVNTKINKENIETGIVINLSQIPTEKLSESDKNALNKITQTFPMMANRDVYIAIVGKPTIENGNLKLDENTQVKIGNFSWKVGDIAKQLGMDETQIKEELKKPLQLGNFNIESLQLQDKQANIILMSK